MNERDSNINTLINKVIYLHAQKVEEAILKLMLEHGLTQKDLRERCTWLTWPDGKNQITLDGRPVIEWGPPYVTTSTAALETGDDS